MTITMPGTATPALAIDGLTVAYRDTPVLWDISLQIPAGRMAAILGPNGAGKSTLLKAALGLVPAARGQVTLLGRQARAATGLIGYVPQRSSVDWDFPTNALDVVEMGMYRHLGWFRRPDRGDRDRALHCLERVGMADFARRQISQLSGGQQQRVFLARALAQDATLYLMDEPFAGVDAATERAIVAVLRDLRDAGKTVVCVHHDLATVRDYFDWAALLSVRLVAAGEVDEVMTWDRLRAAYGGKLALLPDTAFAARAG